MTGIRAHICQVSRFWRDIPILDPPKPKLGPRILLGRSDFHFLMIKKKKKKKKPIIIIDPARVTDITEIVRKGTINTLPAN